MSRLLWSARGRIPGKTLIREAFGAGPRLALKAAVLVCALASQSCLVPQSVDSIPDSPHPAPRFVLESIPTYLLSSQIQLYRQGPKDQSATPPCHCKLELAIPLVEEADPTISLEARWFVDYNPNVPRLAAFVHRDSLDGDFNASGVTIRTIKVPYEFDADALGITSSGVHVVDVVLAESAAFDPASTTRPNRAIKPGYPSDEHRFVINVQVDPDPARLTCPAVLPALVHVCE